MTQDEIIKMAREAGGCEVDEVDPQCFIGLMAFEVWELERFAALVAAAEREACAEASPGLMAGRGLKLSLQRRASRRSAHRPASWPGAD